MQPGFFVIVCEMYTEGQVCGGALLFLSAHWELFHRVGSRGCFSTLCWTDHLELCFLKTEERKHVSFLIFFGGLSCIWSLSGMYRKLMLFKRDVFFWWLIQDWNTATFE